MKSFTPLFVFVMVVGCGGAGEEGLRCPSGGQAYEDEFGVVRCSPAPATDAGPSVDTRPTPDAGQPDLAPPPDTRPAQDAGPDLTPTPDAGTPDTRPLDCAPGATRSCGSNVGECEAGIQVCLTSGSWSSCMDGVPPTSEVCGNGLDDDCDGAIDEGCPVPDAGTPPADAGPDRRDGGVPTTDAGADRRDAMPPATMATVRVVVNAPAGFVIDDLRHEFTAGWTELPVPGSLSTYTADFVLVRGREYRGNARFHNTTTGQVLYLAQFVSGFERGCSGVAPVQNGTIAVSEGARVIAASVRGDPPSGACVANAFFTP